MVRKSEEQRLFDEKMEQLNMVDERKFRQKYGNRKYAPELLIRMGLMEAGGREPAWNFIDDEVEHDS